MNEAVGVCYCDFDGCLHDDAVFWHPRRGIYIGTPGRTLFEWMPILEDLLAPHPRVSLVLSTSWVRMRDFQFAKRKLSPSLQERVIGATFHNRAMRKDEFDNMTRGKQILADVERRSPKNWFAIDNDNSGWPAHLKDHLVLTQDHLGLSEPRVQDEVKKILETWLQTSAKATSES